MPIETRAGKWLRTLREDKCYPCGRGAFIARFQLNWSEETHKNLEDGTTLFNESHVQELIRRGLVTAGSPAYQVLLESLAEDRADRIRSRQGPAKKVERLDEVVTPSPTPTIEDVLRSAEWNPASIIQDWVMLTTESVYFKNNTAKESESRAVDLPLPLPPVWAPPAGYVYPEPIPRGDNEIDSYDSIAGGPVLVLIYRYFKLIAERSSDDPDRYLRFASFPHVSNGASLFLTAWVAIIKTVDALVLLDDVYYGRKATNSEEQGTVNGSESGDRPENGEI